MLGNTSLLSDHVRRFLSLEIISESIKMLLARCSIQIPMGVPTGKVRIISRTTVPAKYPVPRDFVFNRSDLAILPGGATLRSVFLGRITSFDLELGFGYIDTGRLGEEARFELKLLDGGSISALSIHSLVEYEFDDASLSQIVSMRLVPGG